MIRNNDRAGTNVIAGSDHTELSGPTTFFAALFVLIIGTAIIDPSRLLLLLIPGSFLFAAYGIGLLFEQIAALRAAPLPEHLPVLSITMRLGIGIAFLGLSTTVFGLLGFYQLTALVIALGLAWAMIGLIRIWQPIQHYRTTMIPLICGTAMGSAWLIAWLWLTIPPNFYDELAYHLPIAQYALRTGSLPALPWSFFTYMPHLSDLLLGWGLALAGELGARSMHFEFWIAIWIAGWALVETLSTPERSPWIGYVIVGTFASSSSFFFLGTLPFAETSLTFAILASAALIINPTNSRAWLPIGLLWGLACSVKLSGWSWVIASALAALMLKWPLHSVLKASVVTLVTTVPWWGRAWWLTGNPLYPFGYRWLDTLYWNDANQALLQDDLPSLPEPFSVTTLLRLPYDMVVLPERFGSASDCGVLAVVAICLLLSLPAWTFFMKLEPLARRQCYAAGLFILLTATSWIMTSTTTRFFSPALMLGLSVLGTLILKLPKAPFAASLLLLAGLGIWGSSIFISTHNQVFSSLQVALGREPRAEYAARTIDHYEAARFVRDHLPPDAKLLFIGESRPFYFDRTSLAPYPFHEHPLTQWIRETASPEQLRAKLREEGFTHAVLNTREFARLHDHYKMLAFTGPDASLHNQRLKQLPQTLITLFSKHNVYVFEVPTAP